MTTLRRVAVGSRTSPLSLAQTEEILRPLRQVYPDLEFVIVQITTRGDRQKDAPLLSMPRGMFAKDIEVALLNEEIDFAVHSAKDLPAILTDGLVLAAIGERQDPRDVLVNKWGLSLDKLPPGARLGTSSPRRTALLKAARPDIEILPIRGNVDTRMEKAFGDEYDGVVLAAAGLARLGRESEISEYLSPDVCIPDVGQGALAVEARNGDSMVLDLIASVDHRPSNVAVSAERAFSRYIGGGCKAPVAAYARLEGAELHILAMAASPDGARIFRTQETASADDPTAAGHRVAEALMKSGAADVIARGESQ